MKVYREPEKFMPVTLVLESQAEVDALFAVFNHYRLSQAIKLPYDCYLELKPYVSVQYVNLHSEITKLLKP